MCTSVWLYVVCVYVWVYICVCVACCPFSFLICTIAQHNCSTISSAARKVSLSLSHAVFLTHFRSYSFSLSLSLSLSYTIVQSSVLKIALSFSLPSRYRLSPSVRTKERPLWYTCLYIHIYITCVWHVHPHTKPLWKLVHVSSDQRGTRRVGRAFGTADCAIIIKPLSFSSSLYFLFFFFLPCHSYPSKTPINPLLRGRTDDRFDFYSVSAGWYALKVTLSLPPCLLSIVTHSESLMVAN